MKKIIFVIDMLNGFCLNGNLSSKHINNLVPKIKNYLQNNNDEEIIFICDSHSESDIELKTYPSHCLEGSYESKIVYSLEKYAKKIIKKNSTNSFFFLDNLKDLNNYSSFEVVGCCSDICILQFCLTLKTYFNALNLDKDVIVYKNLIDTFNKKDHPRKKFHNFSLKLMKNSGIIVK